MGYKGITWIIAIKFLIGCLLPPRDWDTKHLENGNHQNNCIVCKLHYFGPKRSYICWPCDKDREARWNALSVEEQNVILDQNAKALKELSSKFKMEFIPDYELKH